MASIMSAHYVLHYSLNYQQMTCSSDPAGSPGGDFIFRTQSFKAINVHIKILTNEEK